MIVQFLKTFHFFFSKRYIYTGVLDIGNLGPVEILELLETCDELDFNELIGDLQNHLIIEENEWIEQNLIGVYEISSEHHQSINLLHDYCRELICEKPSLFFNNDDYKVMAKLTIMSILERDDLMQDEVDIWQHLIK